MEPVEYLREHGWECVEETDTGSTWRKATHVLTLQAGEPAMKVWRRIAQCDGSAVDATSTVASSAAPKTPTPAPTVETKPVPVAAPEIQPVAPQEAAKTPTAKTPAAKTPTAKKSATKKSSAKRTKSSAKRKK